MATYRRPGLIVGAIESILGQRDVQVEVLVIDDCPDGSAETVVLGMGDPRVRYMRNPHPSNGRPAIPRNVGWPLTSGEIIHFADDDDLVPDGLYADAMAEFRRFPDIGVVFGSIEAFGEPSKTLVDEQALFARAARRASRLQKLGSARAFAANLLFMELLFVGGSSLVRRRCSSRSVVCRPPRKSWKTLTFLPGPHALSVSGTSTARRCTIGSGHR